VSLTLSLVNLTLEWTRYLNTPMEWRDVIIPDDRRNEECIRSPRQQMQGIEKPHFTNTPRSFLPMLLYGAVQAKNLDQDVSVKREKYIWQIVFFMNADQTQLLPLSFPRLSRPRRFRTLDAELRVLFLPSSPICMHP